MSITTSATGFTAAGFAALLASRREPEWLVQGRRAAWETFQRKPFPSKREEEWMRTDIRLFKLERYALPVAGAAGGAAAPATPMLSHGVVLGGQVLSANGRGQSAHLDAKWAEQGVVFCGLSEALQRHPELVQKFLYRTVDPHQDKFSALHASCWTSGTFLYVPRGVIVDQPLHALNSVSLGEVDLSHTLVVVEEGAEVTFLHESGSPAHDDTGFSCGAMEVVVAPTARLRLVGLQDLGQGVWHFGHQRAVVDRDASLQWTVAAMGSRLAKVNQHVALIGPGAECQVNGVLFTEGKQHLSYHTLQHHQAPYCRSDFLYKSALQDQSHTVWRGMIKVDHGAQKTDGYQRNDNLLLSNAARADAIPGLEINADDVRCTHGATTGRVDEELMFYAQCRGFTRKEAMRIIVTGFFQQVLDRITIESVREALGAAIARRVREYE